MDKTAVLSSVGDADSNKPSSVLGTLQSQTCYDLPAKPMWTQEDTLLIFSPPGLCASNKVLYHNSHTLTPHTWILLYFLFCFLCLHQARLAGRGLFFSTCPFVHLSGKHKINEPVLMPIGTNDPRLTVRVTRSKVEVTKAKYRFSGLVTSLLTPWVK